MHYKTLIWLVAILIVAALAVIFQIIKTGDYGQPKIEAGKLLI